MALDSSTNMIKFVKQDMVVLDTQVCMNQEVLCRQKYARISHSSQNSSFRDLASAAHAPRRPHWGSSIPIELEFWPYVLRLALPATLYRIWDYPVIK